jgi:hypothetical protein
MFSEFVRVVWNDLQWKHAGDHRGQVASAHLHIPAVWRKTFVGVVSPRGKHLANTSDAPSFGFVCNSWFTKCAVIGCCLIHWSVEVVTWTTTRVRASCWFWRKLCDIVTCSDNKESTFLRGSDHNHLLSGWATVGFSRSIGIRTHDSQHSGGRKQFMLQTALPPSSCSQFMSWVEFILRSTVSRPVRLRIVLPFGAHDQILSLSFL